MVSYLNVEQGHSALLEVGPAEFFSVMLPNNNNERH